MRLITPNTIAGSVELLAEHGTLGVLPITWFKILGMKFNIVWVNDQSDELFVSTYICYLVYSSMLLLVYCSNSLDVKLM